MGRNPFSAGRWVCGPQFFGRKELISSLIQSDESCDWIIGRRRIGKTSFLRQVERIINLDHPDKFSLFWDIQGSFDTSGLFDSLYDALEDSQDIYPDKWETFEFEPEDNCTTPQLLKKLSRTLQRAGMRFFLLIDETEELINIGKDDPGLLSKLRRFFQTNRNAHTIIASSPRLEQLNHTVETETSPFLHGFNVSYLGNFTPDAGREMLGQGIQDKSISEHIFTLTDGNPFELQLIGKNYFENGDLDDTLLQLETNPTLNQTIEVNYNLLSEEEQNVLKSVHGGSISPIELEKAIVIKLLRMGYLKQDEAGKYGISSYFQAKWLGVNLFTSPEFHADNQVEIELQAEHKTIILVKVVDIYKIFLEFAQKRKRMEKTEGCFKYSEKTNNILLDHGQISLQEEKRDILPWQIAIEELSRFLNLHLPKDETWSVFRFHQMVEKGSQHYSEKDFLDIMILIFEEASLE